MPHLRPPALLAVADFFYGTLAAVRTLGRAGVRVAVADPHRLAPARWSRYTTRRLVCPEPHDGDRFVDWLLDLGSQGEKHFLYATNDDTAWLFALHRDELATGFHLFQPPIETMYRLLNKRLLFEACREVNLETPGTWFPQSRADLENVAAAANYPVIVKPATQVFLASRHKGSRASNAEELLRNYEEQDERHYARKVLWFDPSVRWPIVQEFFADARRGIYGLSGFVDKTGEIRVARASLKVLQRPKRIGVGLCFEESELREDLCGRLFDLFRHVGYYGVFEAEFVLAGDRALLIDVNPRLYNQVGFDCDRGLPLPLLAYHSAIDEKKEIDELLARTPPNGVPRVYAHRFMLEVTLRAQRLSGSSDVAETRRWREWLARHDGALTDAAFDSDDRVPAVLDVARLVFDYARHPRSFLRSVVLDR